MSLSGNCFKQALQPLNSKLALKCVTELVPVNLWNLNTFSSSKLLFNFTLLRLLLLKVHLGKSTAKMAAEAVEKVHVLAVSNNAFLLLGVLERVFCIACFCIRFHVDSCRGEVGLFFLFIADLLATALLTSDGAVWELYWQAPSSSCTEENDNVHVCVSVWLSKSHFWYQFTDRSHKNGGLSACLLSAIRNQWKYSAVKLLMKWDGWFYRQVLNHKVSQNFL